MLNPQDLQRLIDIITEEVIAAQGVRPASSRVRVPFRAQRLLPGPPARRGRRRSDAARHARDRRCSRRCGFGMIDHTLLKPDATRAEIEKLCREAAEFQFATVCVNPVWVARVGAAAARLRRRRLFRRRIPARGDDGRRQALRDPAGDLRRRPRDRHGDQRRRAEVGRSAHRRARHRSRRRAVPAVRRRSAR